MTDYQLGDLKKKLYRLHFLLTEHEDESTIQESLKHFQNCFKDSMLELLHFFQNEYKLIPKDNNEIIKYSLEYKLFNTQMTDQLKIMLYDFEKLQSGDNSEEIYTKIKESYAGNLQMIHDMLSRMGQDAQEE